MATQGMVNMSTNKFRLFSSPPATFPGKLSIPSIENFLSAIHDMLELFPIAQKFSLVSSTSLVANVSVVNFGGS